MFVTLLVLTYHFETETLTFCNAGHPDFIIKTESMFSPLSQRHPPINTFKRSVYTNTALRVRVPFKLICFSDGVTEAENRREELFGIENVAKSLDQEFGLKELLKNISLFVGDNLPNDDITVMTFSATATAHFKTIK